MASNCHKCRQPLRPGPIDDSVVSLWENVVASSLHAHPFHPPQHTPSPDLSRVPPSLRAQYSAAISPRSPTSKPPVRVTASGPSPPRLPVLPSVAALPGPTDSFVVLTESVVGPARNAVPDPLASPSAPSPQPSPSPATPATNSRPTAPLTPHLTQLEHLYSLLSSQTGVEQPLCTECMDSLLRLLSKELDEGKKERDRLVAFEREISRKREEGPVTREELERDISKWEKKEREAAEELRALEADREALEKEEAELEAAEAALAGEEAAFWTEYGAHLRAQAGVRDALNSLAARHAHGVRELERLAKTNVYNDAFCIGHEAGFGTINKLRLGRLPGTPVEWPEINAAWGHTLLLLHTLARKFAFTFENYKLIPLGSFSRVEKLTGDKAVYELYGSGDFNAVTRVMQNRRFDHAMVAFLDCLRQLMEHVKALDKTIKLPHAFDRVVKDKIGDVSIKYQFGTDEPWTRALRHVLFDLKILLGRASA